MRGKSYVILLLFCLAILVIKYIKLIHRLDAHRLFNQIIKFMYNLPYGYLLIHRNVKTVHMFKLTLINSPETVREYLS